MSAVVEATPVAVSDAPPAERGQAQAHAAGSLAPVLVWIRGPPGPARPADGGREHLYRPRGSHGRSELSPAHAARRLSQLRHHRLVVSLVHRLDLLVAPLAGHEVALHVCPPRATRAIQSEKVAVLHARTGYTEADQPRQADAALA